MHDQQDNADAYRRKLIDNLTFEVVPMKSLDDAVSALPPGAEVSVTCSPLKGIEETQRITEALLQQGFDPIPHFAARMVRDEGHTRELASWLRANGLTKAFVIGGDAQEPGLYPDSVTFLEALLGTDHGLQSVGVGAYPDGHSFISSEQLRLALWRKQELFAEAGVNGYCSTQMCFDPQAISDWISYERAAGFTMPIHLGLSGVVSKTRLLKLGVRLGIGQSLNYLKKNKSAMVKMLTSTSYDPNDLLVPLGESLQAWDVQGLHVFTFNQVEATNVWREQNR